MRSIRAHRFYRPVSADVLEDTFDSLRDAFLARLQSDRVQLTIFAATLTRDDDDATRLFERLHQFSHRTRGVAAVFHSAQVASAATALEQATAAAALTHANGSDPAVWAALVALTDVLASAGRSP